MSHEEVEVPLDENSFNHLLPKADGTVISKTRYIIPEPPHTIELDVFGGDLSGFILAEVEFSSETEATSYTAPDWFGKEVTYDPLCHNVNLISLSEEERAAFLSEYGYTGSSSL